MFWPRLCAGQILIWRTRRDPLWASWCRTQQRSVLLSHFSAVMICNADRIVYKHKDGWSSITHVCRVLVQSAKCDKIYPSDRMIEINRWWHEFASFLCVALLTSNSLLFSGSTGESSLKSTGMGGFSSKSTTISGSSAAFSSYFPLIPGLSCFSGWATFPLVWPCCWSDFLLSSSGSFCSCFYSKIYCLLSSSLSLSSS